MSPKDWWLLGYPSGGCFSSPGHLHRTFTRLPYLQRRQFLTFTGLKLSHTSVLQPEGQACLHPSPSST